MHNQWSARTYSHTPHPALPHVCDVHVGHDVLGTSHVAHGRTRMRQQAQRAAHVRITNGPAKITSIYNENGIIIKNIEKKLINIFIKNINKI